MSLLRSFYDVLVCYKHIAPLGHRESQRAKLNLDILIKEEK